jgi:hypothetical protein
MSLGIYSFRLAVTTKSRRAVTLIQPIQDIWITTQADEPIVTQNLRNIVTQQLTENT